MTQSIEKSFSYFFFTLVLFQKGDSGETLINIIHAINANLQESRKTNLCEKHFGKIRVWEIVDKTAHHHFGKLYLNTRRPTSQLR